MSSVTALFLSQVTQLKMKESRLRHAIEACLDNGERLLSDALMLEFSKPPATAFALVIIAQEEFAKAFLLTLVYKRVIEWNELIWRTTRDHTCKQLLATVMDYLNPDFDEFIARIKAPPEKAKGALPSHIADALNIFRHEKIGRWHSRNWFWVDPPNYDQKAKKVSKGQIDRLKQDQLYVDIGRSGSVIPKTVVSQKQFEDEKDRAERLCSLVRGMVEDEKTPYLEYEEVTDAFRMLFESMTSHNDYKP